MDFSPRLAMPTNEWKIYPATFNQETRSADGIRTATHPNDFFAIRLHGHIDRGALEDALRDVVDRHDSLRTDFPEVAGRRVQRVWRRADVEFRFLDLTQDEPQSRDRAVAAASAREVAVPFDVERAPLLRAMTFRLGVEHHIFAIVCDPLIMDGLSANILWSEFLHFYGQRRNGVQVPLAPVRRQFGDFAQWERERLQGHRMSDLRRFWKDKLAVLPPVIAWRAASARPNPFTYHSDVVRCTFTSAELKAMQLFAAEQRSTLFAVFNSLFSHVLLELGAQDEALMYSTVANRRHADFNGTIGRFANGVILRLKIPTGTSFLEHLAHSTQVAREALAYGEFPLTFIGAFVGARSDASFGYRTQIAHFHYSFFRLPQVTIAGLTSAPELVSLDEVSTTWAYDLGFCSYLYAGVARFDFWYNTGVLDRQSVKSAVEHLQCKVRCWLKTIANSRSC
jgi:hypothetical protein